MTKPEKVYTKADRIYTRLEDKRMEGETIYATLVITEITRAGKDVELHRQEIVIEDKDATT